jgi:hypothetical protein
MAARLLIREPATERRLATLAAVKSDLSITGSGNDAALTALIDQSSEQIAIYLGISYADDASITLALESITETIRVSDISDTLSLGRFPVVPDSAIITENGVTLTPGQDFEVLGAWGIVRRLAGDSPISWTRGIITAEYDAGWIVPDSATVDPPMISNLPITIEMACREVCKSYWSIRLRDPAIKSETDVGVYSVTFMDAPSEQNGALTMTARAMLESYRRIWIG